MYFHSMYKSVSIHCEDVWQRTMRWKSIVIFFLENFKRKVNNQLQVNSDNFTTYYQPFRNIQMWSVGCGGEIVYCIFSTAQIQDKTPKVFDL